MTQLEFEKIKFGASMRVKYRGSFYGIVSVNFYEKLLGIIEGAATGDDSADDLIWVRCENVELTK